MCNLAARCVAFVAALAMTANAHAQPGDAGLQRAQAMLVDYIHIDTTTPPVLPGEDKDAVVAQLREVVDDERIRLDPHAYWGDTPSAPMEGEVWDALSRAVEQTVPESFVTPTISPATTDSRYFAQAGIPAYRLLPFVMNAEERQRLHAKDERLSLENLALAIKFYRVAVGQLVR